MDILWFIAIVVIGYVLGIPWAIFFVVANLVMTFFSFHLISLLIVSIIGYAVLLHYDLPWWYIMLFTKDVFKVVEYKLIRNKFSVGKIDEVQQEKEVQTTDTLADIMFLIVFGIMIYKCFFD